MNSQRLNELAVNITERLFDTGAADQEATQNALAFVVAKLKPVFECLESADKDGRKYAILAGTNAARAEKAERERDELRERLSLVREQRDAELNKNTQLEAEIARRDAAAGGPVLDPQAIGWVDSEELRSIDKNRHATIYKIEPDNPYHDPRRQKLVYLAPPAASAPDGLAAAVNQLLDSDGSRGTFSAIRRGDALAEVERLLATAPAPGGDCGDQG